MDVEKQFLNSNKNEFVFYKDFTNISLSFLQKYVVNHNSCHQDQYRSNEIKQSRISTSCEILTLTEKTFNVLKPLIAQ